MDLAGDLFNFFGSIMVVSCSGRFIAHCSAIDAAYKPEMFEAYALPMIINSVIVISLILRAGRNSPPAVNQPWR
jgi:hypothetical protein